MEQRVATRTEFAEEVRRLAAELGEVVWEQIVEHGHTAGADGWLREAGRCCGASWGRRGRHAVNGWG